MGSWSELAEKQLKAAGDMNTREALRLVAYWQGRLPLSPQSWRPALSSALRNAPERKRITSRLIASDRLLRMIYGETKTRPTVMGKVMLLVATYIKNSAKLMDARKPDAIPPVIPGKLLDQKAVSLARLLNTPRPAQREKGSGAGIIILLLLLAAEKGR